MLVHDPDGTTIGVPGLHDFRKRRANPIASSRKPSLNAAWPQQKLRRKRLTFSPRRLSTVSAAAGASGNIISPRQVEKSVTVVTAMQSTPGADWWRSFPDRVRYSSFGH